MLLDNEQQRELILQIVSTTGGTGLINKQKKQFN